MKKATFQLLFTTVAIWSLCGLPCRGLTIQLPSGNHDRIRLSDRIQTKMGPVALQQTSRLKEQHDENCIENSKNKLGLTAALFTTYFAVISAKCALPSTFSLLTSPTSGLSFSVAGRTATEIGQQSMARLLTLSTLTIAVGKFILGPIIDALGGILSLKIALTALSTLLAIISTTNSFKMFSLSWLLVDFIFSSCWAACINAVHQSFPPQNWSTKVAMLATAARTGNAVAFATFALILKSERIKTVMSCIINFISGGLLDQGKGLDPSWRIIFLVSSFLQLIPLILLSIFGKTIKSTNVSLEQTNAAENESNVSKISTENNSALAAVKKQLKTTLFWLHFTSRTALMIFGSFLLFVPSYMIHCYGMTNSQSAQVASTFALGCLLSLVFVSKAYTNFGNKRRKVVFISGMLLISNICAIFQWLHVSLSFPMISLSPFLGSLVMFLWGFSFAIPFYLPPSLYALKEGGKKSSATIADVFDIGGFGLLALFNGYVAGITQSIPSAWSNTFVALIICSFVSLASLSTATILENRNPSS